MEATRQISDNLEEMFSKLCKEKGLTRSEAGKQHFHSYAAEFEFRYNNRIGNGVGDIARANIALHGIVGKKITYRDSSLAKNLGIRESKMATPTDIESDLTLDLGDDVSPEEFVAAIRNFFGYTKEITESQSGDGVDVNWTVQVKKGSNLIALSPIETVSPSRLAMIYRMAEHGVTSLAQGNIKNSGISDKAINHLKALSDLAKKTESNHGINIWVKKNPIRIGREISRTVRDDWERDYYDVGTLEGRLEAIQDAHGSLKIRINDFLFPNAITCVVTEGMINKVLNSFRRRVEIEGRIHYRKDGTPISIEAYHINLLPEDEELPSAADVRGIMLAT